MDLASGMDEIGLLKYLKVNSTLAAAVFPRQAEAVIDKEELKSRIIIQNDEHPQGQVIVDFLHRFIDKISQEADGTLLISWPFWDMMGVYSWFIENHITYFKRKRYLIPCTVDCVLLFY